MNLDQLGDFDLSKPVWRPPVSRPVDQKLLDLETILNITRQVNTSLVLSDVLDLVLDEAIRVAGAERGFLMLADGQRKLSFTAGRTSKRESITANSFEVSSSVLEDVFCTGESMCVEHALCDERFERRESIMALELQTIICAPLKTHDDIIGVIYVDSRSIQPVDKERMIQLFGILAGQSAIAIKNARLFHELKTTYEELRNANKQIIQFERMAMKGEIAAEVSHELKNLVAVVLLNLQVIQRKLDATMAEEIRQVVDKTIAGAKKIQNFSMNLLTRSGQGSNLLPHDVNTLAGDFTRFMGELPKYKRNSFTVHAGANIPKVHIDIDQIQQVLLNLINNAVEAHPEAAIEISTRSEVNEGRVIIALKDNGPGISPDVLQKLFNEKVTTKVDGHGYGLSICKQIIESHGGKITVESEMGNGATFLISLPLIKD